MPRKTPAMPPMMPMIDASGDGDTQDLNENVSYGLFSLGGIQRLGRQAVSGGQYKTMAEHVQSLQFHYYDGTGNILTSPVGSPSQIKHIKVVLTIQTAREEPGPP